MLELLVTVTVLGLIAILGIPNIRNAMRRARLEGVARETAALSQRARLEAIKQNRQTVVLADIPGNEIRAFVDTDEDRVQGAGEELLGRVPLPSRVEFRGATGSPPDSLAVEGFGGVGGPVFEPNGSVLSQGAIRFADNRNNVLEVRVMSEATGRVAIRKWLDATMDVAADAVATQGGTGEATGWYEKGDEGRAWVWN